MKLRLILTILLFAIIVGGGSIFFELGYEVPDDSGAVQTVDVAARLQYDALVEQVVPAVGKTIVVNWGDTGHRLVDAGAIDLKRMDAMYGGMTAEQWRILQTDEVDSITLNHRNIRFWTNVLWSMGLVQQTKVLSEGPMAHQTDTPLGNFASTGGWTLGALPAAELYNSTQIVSLTPEQDELIYRVAQHVYRPCCGNHTAFPDCNHGMAVLGLMALMASQDATEDKLYAAALAFNSYAFTDTYITTAAYFTLQDINWDAIEASRILGPEYSSIQGSQRIAAEVGLILGAPGQVSGCST